MFTRWNVVAGGLICLAAFSLVFAGDAFAQRKPLNKPGDALRLFQADKEAPAKGKLDVVYYGNSACNNKGCHGGDPPKKWFRDSDSGAQAELIARCVEANIYEKDDKHADAFNVLGREGGLGQRMAKVLK